MVYTKITNKAALNYINLSEAKRQLNITDDEDDSHVQLLIDAAYDLSERYTKRMLSECDVSLAVKGESVFFLPYGEARDVVSVQVDGVDVDYTFNEVTQKLSITDPTDEEVVIVYKAGYIDGAVPNAVKMGTLMMISSLYEHREDSVVGATVASIPLNSKAMLDAYRIEGVS